MATRISDPLPRGITSQLLGGASRPDRNKNKSSVAVVHIAVQYLLVMQCFLMEYLGICQVSLDYVLNSVHVYQLTTSMWRKYIRQVACSMVSHEFPCLSFWKVYSKLLEELKNLWNSWTLEKLQNPFWRVFTIFENFRKIFRNLLKFLENFRNGSKLFLSTFYDFWKFLENVRKLCFEIIRKFVDLIRTVRKSSQELESIRELWFWVLSPRKDSSITVFLASD